MADRVAILRAGRLVASGAIEEVKARARQRLAIRFRAPPPVEAFAGLPSVREASVSGALLQLTVEGSVDAVIKAAAQYHVLAISSHEPNLEEIFLEYYQDDDRDGPPAP